MYRVAWKVPGGVITERWRVGTWLGKRFHTEEHIVAREGDGLVIRSRAAKLMPEVTTTEDLDAIKGSPWPPSGVSRDVLPDVPRPTLSRDDPTFAPDDDRPVPQNMKITHDIIKRFGYTPGCTKCRKLSRDEYSHPSFAHSEECRNWSRQQVRQTLCIAIVLSEHSSEGLISTRRKWNEVIIRGEAHWNQKLCLDAQRRRQKTKTAQVFGKPNGLAESQNRICREKSPFKVLMRHSILHSSRLSHQVRLQFRFLLEPFRAVA